MTASTESLEQALQMSESEMKADMERRPGAVRVTGVSGGGSGGGGQRQQQRVPDQPPPELVNRDFSDLRQQDVGALMSMDFTLEQTAHALRSHNYDVNMAAQYLLGAM